MKMINAPILFPIRLLVLDVDGTLTDGRIYMSAAGEAYKAFYVRDGYAIKHMLPEAGICAAIITGRESSIVAVRAQELGIKYVFQNVTDKAERLNKIKSELGLEWREIACIGDDVNDLPMIRLCGITACPADSVIEVKERCDYICKANGGHGAVREFIEWIIHGQKPFATNEEIFRTTYM